MEVTSNHGRSSCSAAIAAASKKLAPLAPDTAAPVSPVSPEPPPCVTRGTAAHAAASLCVTQGHPPARVTQGAATHGATTPCVNQGHLPCHPGHCQLLCHPGPPRAQRSQGCEDIWEGTGMGGGGGMSPPCHWKLAEGSRRSWVALAAGGRPRLALPGAAG